MDIGIGMKMNQIARQQVGYGFTKGIITKGISNELKIGKKPLKNAPCNFEQFSKFGSIQPAPHICGAGFFCLRSLLLLELPKNVAHCHCEERRPGGIGSHLLFVHISNLQFIERNPKDFTLLNLDFP